ncbi:MAG TPA: putative maltokinase, partial [Urbifossiella sp.]
GPSRRQLERLLPGFLASRRWFGGKARTIRSAHIADVIPIRPTPVSYAVVQVNYNEGEPEQYLIPLGFGNEEHVRSTESTGAASILARVEVKKGGARTSGVLYDAFGDEALSTMMLEMISSKRRFHGEVGHLAGRPSKSFRRMRSQAAEPLKVTASKADQSNSTLTYGDKFLLKQFRRIEEGVNPELEIGEFLTETVAFSHSPPLAGAIEYLVPQRPSVTVGVLQGYVHNAGTAWNYALEAAEAYFEPIIIQQPLPELPPELVPHAPLLTLAAGEPPPVADTMFGSFLQSAELLGRRTAEMHIALATPTDQPQFGSEPFTPHYQRSLYQAMRNTAVRTIALLKRKVGDLADNVRPRAEAVLVREQEINKRLKEIVQRKITAMRIRCHGDYHLGQVLYTGNDFVIIDYEGEPIRSISERQIKRSPFRDLAGMIRSFDYACYSALADQITGLSRGHEELQRLRGWIQFWTAWTSAAFLKSYMAVAQGQPFIAATAEESQILLDVYTLEKAIYELRYELNNRPEWARIPLYGILELLDEAKAS